MLFTLEALNAEHGDALLLHFGTPAKPKLAVIDGGPAGVYAKALRPRLAQLRAARVPGGGPLPVRLAMITHIDDDHIRGVLDLLDGMAKKRDDQEPPDWKIDSLWFNSFDDILGNSADELAAAVKTASNAAAAGLPLPPNVSVKHFESALVAASVNQGRTVRDQAKRLKIARNAEAGGGLITAAPAGRKRDDPKIEGLKMTVLSPFRNRVEALQKEWDEQLKKMKATKQAAAKAIAAEFLDESVFNLSSIAVLVEAGGESMLLTGDARGDDVIAGLKAAKRLKDGRCHVGVLKIPHHGSDRNVATEFFQQVTADHYVISANGKFGNPDPPTLKMLTGARGSDEYTIHLTNMPPPPHPAKAFFDHDMASTGRKYKVVVRDAAAVSLRVELGDPLGE